MRTVLLLIHFFIASALVGVILIQRSEGGALGGLGGGTMGGMMTARGSANLLTRVTTVLAGLFFVISLVLGILFRSAGEQKSIIDVEEDLPVQTLPVEGTVGNGKTEPEVQPEPSVTPQETPVEVKEAAPVQRTTTDIKKTTPPIVEKTATKELVPPTTEKTEK